MIAKYSPQREKKTMSAIITTTSKTVETQLIHKGVIVDTKYHQTENQAIDYVESHNVLDIEFQEMDI